MLLLNQASLREDNHRQGNNKSFTGTAGCESWTGRSCDAGSGMAMAFMTFPARLCEG